MPLCVQAAARTSSRSFGPYPQPPSSTPPAEAIVDIATLTGACMIALGDGMCALYSSTDDVAAAVQAAAKAAGALRGVGLGRYVGSRWLANACSAPHLHV